MAAGSYTAPVSVLATFDRYLVVYDIAPSSTNAGIEGLQLLRAGLRQSSFSISANGRHPQITAVDPIGGPSGPFVVVYLEEETLRYVTVSCP